METLKILTILFDNRIFILGYFSLPNIGAGWNKRAGWQNLEINKRAEWNKAMHFGILGILLPQIRFALKIFKI